MPYIYISIGGNKYEQSLEYNYIFDNGVSTFIPYEKCTKSDILKT